MGNISQQAFVAKWRASALTERASAQEHFIDLCRLIEHPTPAESDSTGAEFTFEAGVNKIAGGKGWADVWKSKYFGWEYKGKHANLDKAYQQILQYREALQNPPLLIVCDIDTIVIHTNFTNTIKRTITITLVDLLTTAGIRQLRNVFYDPLSFESPITSKSVTEGAAKEFARLSALLGQNDHDPEQIAHFLIRLLFCLFAEDVGLLPNNIFTRLIVAAQRDPSRFTKRLRDLFGAMATGGDFGADNIRHFNGGLFDSDVALPLPHEAISILSQIAKLDWSNIEPSILGTLFERSLNPSKRAQLGAHYTSRDDILLIVEPVLMQPLRRRWEEVQGAVLDIANKRKVTKDRAADTRYRNQIKNMLEKFSKELAAVRILDPACGSGNFLYVALRQMLDLWKEVSVFSGEQGLPLMAPLPTLSPSPTQLYGIEIDRYAYELATVTVWIGYIQWFYENGFGFPPEPILKMLDNIKNMDAILAYDDEGKPVDPEWPEADVIIGNPPFLGSRKVRPSLGNTYCNSLANVYAESINGLPDLVCYWFAKCAQLIANDKVNRVGLIATQAIRGKANRQVLTRINQVGNIFMAWSDNEWILDGAMVNISIVAFDNGSEKEVRLNGESVHVINPDLTASLDISQSQQLRENEEISFQGVVLRGPFNISFEEARRMLGNAGNPNGQPNSDVIKPRFMGKDVVGRNSNTYVIDFGTDMSIASASEYLEPFEYVKTHVYPVRQKANQASAREKWWIHWNTRIQMRKSIDLLSRYIVTPRVSKHRIFVWLDGGIIPDCALAVIARDDDYFMGILHSTIHELWSLRQGTQLRDAKSGFRYTHTTTFETFPFPWPPGKEPTDDPIVQEIAHVAKDLVEKRDNWLNPPALDDQELKKRTLTNLYNQRPAWLDMIHQRLDKAVLAAYGWSDLMTESVMNEDELLSRLLALNLERSALR